MFGKISSAKPLKGFDPSDQLYGSNAVHLEPKSEIGGCNQEKLSLRQTPNMAYQTRDPEFIVSLRFAALGNESDPYQTCGERNGL